jgi:hypothetical protein
MKIATLIASVSAASDMKSVWYDLGDLTNYSIIVGFTGSNVVGTLTLEVCGGSSNPNEDVNAIYAVRTGSSQAVTASTSHIYEVAGAGSRWVRLAWDYTSGTGNIEVKIEVKEPSRGG